MPAKLNDKEMGVLRMVYEYGEIGTFWHKEYEEETILDSKKWLTSNAPVLDRDKFGIAEMADGEIICILERLASLGYLTCSRREQHFHLEYSPVDTWEVTRLGKQILHGDMNEQRLGKTVNNKELPSNIEVTPSNYLKGEKMDKELKGRLATSTHYLRYFIFGGYVAFLSQVPDLLASSITLADISILGSFITIICIIMDYRNYFKYRKITGKSGFGVTTVFLTLFYITCFLWFLSLPGSEYEKRRYESAKTNISNLLLR